MNHTKLTTCDQTTKDTKNMDKRVIINVGGSRHETLVSTLERIPGTRLALLAHLQEADESYDVRTNEYFFDRHPQAFCVIMHYYRTEELHIDTGVCGNVLKGEFQFWGLEEQEIEACCWADYSKYTEHKETLRDLDDNFMSGELEGWDDKKSKWKKWATNIWEFLEEPSSSRMAKFYAITSMFFVALSIMNFVLETHSMFQIDKKSGKIKSELVEDAPTPTGSATVCCCGDGTENNITNSTSQYDFVPHPALEALDYITVAFFTIELVARFSFAPRKKQFCKEALNIIDFVCLLPHYAAIILTHTMSGSNDYTYVFKTIMMLRIIRILRIFKLMKHYTAFKILVYTIKVSTKELLLMIVFLMSGVLMFASIMHYAEKDNFPNIPIAIWWALVTMTTVGYGDKYPVGYVGYGVGCFCVICGVLVIAFTVPIVVNNFSLYYSHAQTRTKLPNKKKHRMMRVKARIEALNNHPGAGGGWVGEKGKGTGGMTKTYIGAANGSNTARKPLHFSEIPAYTPRSVVTSRDMPTYDNTTGLRDTHGHGHQYEAKRDMTRRISGPTSKVSTAGTGPAAAVGAGGPVVSVRSVAPVEKTELEDMESVDSGISPDSSRKMYEDETKQVMSDMKEANTKLLAEKKRQAKKVREKREKRIKEKTTSDVGAPEGSTKYKS